MNRDRIVLVGTGLAATALAALLGLAGCGSAPSATAPAGAVAADAPSSGAALPQRPRSVPVDGIDACAVITSPLRLEFGVSSRMDRNPAGDGLASSDCEWTNFPAEPGLALFVRLVRNQGVDAYLGQPGAQLTTVSGFGAVELPGQLANPDEGCVVRVDVASGQSLWVGYTSDGPIPGRTHSEMCARARTASASVLAQLLARVR